MINYYIENNQKFNSFGCHGNQGVNPCISAVLEIYILILTFGKCDSNTLL